jgi:hypothetical protein
MPTAERTRADIERVKQHDADYGANQDLLLGRIRNVIQAQRAHSCRQAGAVPAFRQSLVDLAAVAEALASEMRTPSGGT